MISSEKIKEITFDGFDSSGKKGVWSLQYDEVNFRSGGIEEYAPGIEEDAPTQGFCSFNLLHPNTRDPSLSLGSKHWLTQFSSTATEFIEPHPALRPVALGKSRTEDQSLEKSDKEGQPI